MELLHNLGGRGDRREALLLELEGVDPAEGGLEPTMVERDRGLLSQLLIAREREVVALEGLLVTLMVFIYVTHLDVKKRLLMAPVCGRHLADELLVDLHRGVIGGQGGLILMEGVIHLADPAEREVELTAMERDWVELNQLTL